MSRLLAIIAIAAVSICGGGSAFAEGHGGEGHGNMGHRDGGHFGGGHGGGFHGGGFGGPGIGFGVAPAYYDYGYDSGCYQLQRVWTGRRWQMRQIQVC
jgi:hypothetical protein